MTAFHCHVCGSKDGLAGLTSEVFALADRRVLVEGIPMVACARCGEVVISRETTERVRAIVHGQTRPVRTESLDVFALA
jgi:HTH-type transcriptional regulator / antitoxin MqsA